MNDCATLFAICNTERGSIIIGGGGDVGDSLELGVENLEL